MLSFSNFIPRFNKISVLCGYHWKRERIGGERDGDFTDTSNRFNSKRRGSQKSMIKQWMDTTTYGSQVTKVAKHRRTLNTIVSHKMTKILPMCLKWTLNPWACKPDYTLQRIFFGIYWNDWDFWTPTLPTPTETNWNHVKCGGELMLG
jgi:hypothetical protein